jgi:flagellar basal body-associated protein FliL
MDLFFDNMGGLSVFVLIIIATVFAIGAFIYFLYTRKKKESSLDNDENLHKMRL